MKHKPITFSAFILLLGIISCTLPSAPATQSIASNLTSEEMTATAAALALNAFTSTTVTYTDTPQSTETVVPSATSCIPTVVTNTNANVRSGPGTVYSIVDAVPQGTNLTVAGKNDTGTWWYIDYSSASGGHAWIAGSVTTSTCIPTSLVIIAAPPTPKPASGTCKDNYVHRLINSSDKVCVAPASKAQADADNAAAESRKVTAAYGPDTCVLGYVWREARSSDDVCVDSAVRTQAATDNAAAASRKATAAYGPDTCAQGYVWREAFSGDHICVEPAIRDQVAADNVAAPSHTWP